MSFNVSIYSPSMAVARNIKASELIVPTVNGQIGILKGHTHIVSKLDTGVLLVKGEGNTELHFLVTTGICKVLKDEVIILSHVCERAEDVNTERAEKALKLAESRLSGDGSLKDHEMVKFMRKRDRAKVRLLLSIVKKKHV